MSYQEKQIAALKTVKRVALVGLGANLALTALKLVFGFIFLNMAILSDAAHSGMDSIVTLLVLVSAFFSSPKRDREHNYGHEKREAVFVLLVSLFMFGMAILLIVQGIRGITNIQQAEWNLLLIIVAAISILVKEALFQFTNYFAKRTHSAALRADAWGHRVDCITSFAVLVGLVCTIWLRSDLAESIAVLVVSLFILRIAYKVFRGAYFQLTDRAADARTHAKIAQLAKDTEGVLGVDKLHTRLFGSGILVDMEIKVDGHLSVAQGHEIAHTVHDLLEADPDLRIKHCNIHVNPN